MEFYGLLGKPLGHSLSPLIQQIIAKELDLNTAYALFEVDRDQLADALKALKVLGIKGANVTIPYKQEVMPYLDRIDPHAEHLQAVNTIKVVEGQLVGFNTDYEGVQRTIFCQGWQVEDQQVFILGTGGAARAVAYALADLGGHVCLVSRQPQKKLAFPCVGYEDLASQTGHLLVNATPLGMPPQTDRSPVDLAVIDSFDLIFDLTYGKEKNQFLSWAEEAGKSYCDGLQMLVGQALAAVEIWQNCSIDDGYLDRVIHKLKEGW